MEMRTVDPVRVIIDPDHECTYECHVLQMNKTIAVFGYMIWT